MIIIDRFEGDFAVLETDSGMIETDRTKIPENAAEGDVLIMENGVYIVDVKGTEMRRESIRNTFKRLRRKRND